MRKKTKIDKRKMIRFTSILVFVLVITISPFILANTPKKFTVTFDGLNPVEYTTTIRETKEAFKELKIADEQDIIEGPDFISNNAEFNIKKSKELQLVVDNLSLVITTNASTVKEMLDERDIKYDKNDLIQPSLDQSLTGKSNVSVKKVDILDEEERLDIDYKTEVEYDFNKEIGDDTIIQTGQKGTRLTKYKVVKVSDNVISRQQAESTVEKAEVNEKIIKGSRLVEEEVLEFETETRYNEDEYTDYSNTIQQGQNGLQRKTFRVEDDKKELIKSERVKEVVNEIIEIGTKQKQNTSRVASSTSTYSLNDLMFHGIINWNGYKFTYYSQSVLPGNGLSIPGRHINSQGYVADTDGYRVLASNFDVPRYSVIDTPFGAPGKVYDRCESCTLNWYDVYTQ